MRVVLAPNKSQVVYCGIAVDTGTRDELPEESGMAHFVEHMSFKGTRKHRASHIINCMDRVGGDLNAYTGKEETVFYCTFLREHFKRAIRLLVEIVSESTFPQSEMDKEVEVVIDEIESYNDSPSELIFDDFEALLFEGHPLGRNILGEAERLRKYRSEDMLRFVQRNYAPERMVLFIYGDVEMREVVSILSPLGAKIAPCKEMKSRTDRFSPLPQEKGRLVVKEMDTHQCHVMIGTRCYGGSDPRHLHLYLLNNIIGGPAMSSRLNLALRERNGLVYTVESNMTCYTDTGVWSVYFGCDPEDVERCRKLVVRELKRMAEAPLSERALQAAKRQIKGQIGVSYDNGESVALGMGKRTLHYNITQTQEQLCLAIDRLTAEELWQTAKEIFNPERLTTLIYR